jgi:hypothetical protein
MSKRPDFDYRYSIIPGGAVTDDQVSMRDLQVLALLGRHTDKKGWCWRSQVEMAQELRCGRATVSRSIKRLIKAGWLEAKPLPRGRTVLAEGEQPFSAFKYRVKIDRDEEESSAPAEDVPNNGHPPMDGEHEQPKNGHGVPTADGHGVPTQAGTHRRTPFKDQLNIQMPAAAGEGGNVASLGQGSPERFPEFRKAVEETWPFGFPAENETAARKAFVKITRSHDPTLVIHCARLHGQEKRKQRDRRGKDADLRLKLPANWLKDGDWEGYIARAEAEAAREVEMVSALGRVQRAVGDGLFKLLRRNMADVSIAMLDGITLAPPATVTITNGFQRTLLERHETKIERLFGERPSFVMVPKAAAS